MLPGLVAELDTTGEGPTKQSPYLAREYLTHYLSAPASNPFRGVRSENMCARALTTWPQGHTQANEEKMGGDSQHNDAHTQSLVMMNSFYAQNDGETLTSLFEYKVL